MDDLREGGTRHRHDLVVDGDLGATDLVRELITGVGVDLGIP